MFWSSPGLKGLLNRTVDVSLGGARIYCSDKVKQGDKLDLDLALPNGINVNVLAQVAWVKTLPEGAVAPYDVGVQFLQMPEATREIMEAILTHYGSEGTRIAE